MNKLVPVLGALALSACTTIPGLVTMYSSMGSSWPVKPVEASDMKGQEGTANVGDFLFTQPTRLAMQAKIEGDHEVFQVNRDGTRGQMIPVLEDNPLGAVTGFPRGVLPFCAYRPTLDKRSNVLDQRVLRVCLLDTDADMVFDRPLFAAVAGQGTGGALSIGQQLPIMLNGHPEIAISYTVEAADTAEFVNIGPMIEKGPLGNYFLSFAIEFDGRPVSLDESGNYSGRKLASTTDVNNAYNVKFGPADLPVTLDVAGATVTVLSIDEREVRYRIEEPYKPNEPFLLGYAAEPGYSSKK
ncbi:hypothetical protein [Parvularcula lutaonensis]|uniref:Lipoprotein n=1 Tax=Parvularcula lutaonensis TaxID=491923 RepID=A0ABV7M9M6_9PROT|nr:hypothetical protein [Parvularcula lutaonensis]GGY44880.1 hypothetical protein GCM10007148_12280 [Parvularcula lutaonensis]